MAIPGRHRAGLEVDHFGDGHAVVPDEPGLGCELDMEAVERYVVRL